MLDLLIKNANVVTPLANDSAFMNEKDYSIGVKDGKIAYIGASEEDAAQTINAEGRLVTPGLVDCHTHLVFGGFREHEFSKKLAGVLYLDILRAGGGILSTVEATRNTDFNELYEKSDYFLSCMLFHGTTTVEAKSGYGLDLETELKQLKVIKKLQERYDLVSTFMGAHAVPKEYKTNPSEYTRLLTDELLPAVADENLAEFCDIFCEDSVFDIKTSQTILEAAAEKGFGLKIHADEVVPMGGAALAAKVNAKSAEHLIEADNDGLQAMARAGTIAVLLPATSFYLNKNYARARAMLDMGITVAIASDFNPGSSPNYNLQVALNLACLRMGLSPEEALTAATINAAKAINREGTKGSIELQKDADLVIWDCPNLEFLFYRYGNNQVHKVVKNGKLLSL
ncbi:MAG: imidazolonepropionase [Turicibacter sp.]|nr:imidazolonepropionase [Turicibacter sp.]